MTTDTDAEWMPPSGARLEWDEMIAEEKAEERLALTTCSRFSAARIEELLQARDNLAEGDEISHQDACDLVNWYADELERVRNAYQSRLGDLMLKAMDLTNSFAEAMPFPENDPTLPPR